MLIFHLEARIMENNLKYVSSISADSVDSHISMLKIVNKLKAKETYIIMKGLYKLIKSEWPDPNNICKSYQKFPHLQEVNHTTLVVT